MTKTCVLDGCDRKVLARGLCGRHYQRAKVNGSLEAYQTQDWGAPKAWLLANVSHVGSDCLIWPFGIAPIGYGALRYDNATVFAHRLMCCLAHGEPVGERRHAAHSCGNRACVNPAHLRWATHKENHADRHKHGTVRLGENSPAAKLTAEQVVAMRSDARSDSEVAAELKVTRSTVNAIRARKSWAWLT